MSIPKDLLTNIISSILSFTAGEALKRLARKEIARGLPEQQAALRGEKIFLVVESQ